jgi:hypothetical protein
MALECIWALPPLKTMLCLGFAFLVGSLAQKTFLVFDDRGTNNVLMAFMTIFLVCLYHVIYLAVTRFKPGNVFSFGLILMLVGYLLLVVINETGVLFHEPLVDRSHLL